MKVFRANWLVFVILALLFAGLTACSGSSEATAIPTPEPTRDPVLEQTIVAQLEAINPKAVPVYQEATSLFDSGDLDKSEQLYQQVLDLAPNFATAYRRLGYIEGSRDNVDGAIELMRKAVALEPDGYNKTALAQVLLDKNTSESDQEAFILAGEAAKLLPEDEDTLVLWVVSSAYVNDTDSMRQADAQLLKISPNHPVAHYFAGVLAATDKKWEKAEQELLLSQRLGMPADSVQYTLAQGISKNAMITRLLRWGVIAMAAWFLGLALLFVVGSVLSKITLKAVNSAQSSISTQVSPGERRVRSIYRFVIVLLSLYFYISIPFVIILLLLVVGGALYAFYLVGTIPIYFAAILVIMLFVSVFAILRAIFTRTRSDLPGRKLERSDAPGLWALLDDVARKLDIQPVDSVQITPDILIGVNEKGNIFKKMKGSGKRNLLLGLGGITGLTQGQLASILAHEYGHFSNRDTAGGNFSHQVYASLNQMAYHIIRSRMARIYNPAWLFIYGYQRLFLMVTFGASRLQEILADRYAAMAYGSDNFVDGLTNYIRQSIAFPLQASYEIKNSQELKRAILNLYDLPAQEELPAGVQLEVEDKVKQAMTCTTSKYDSHPAPQERIELVKRLNIPYSPLNDNPHPALELFTNPEQLQREMTDEIMKRVNKPAK